MSVLRYCCFRWLVYDRALVFEPSRPLACIMMLVWLIYVLELCCDIFPWVPDLDRTRLRAWIMYDWIGGVTSLVATMSFMLGGKQTVKKPLSVFFNWSHYLPAIIGFGSIHRLLPSLWISACTPYIISLCCIPMHDSYCKQCNWTCRAKETSLAWQ